MPFAKDAEPLPQEPQTPAYEPRAWSSPSLFAAFNVALLVFFSGLFFAFPCRWLAETGEWAIPVGTGLLFVLSFVMVVWMNVSDPGILHQGSIEQGPQKVFIASVNNSAFRLQWCPHCAFHRPPRTFHCPWCNICVEAAQVDKCRWLDDWAQDFDHHCRWINNCVGRRNFRLFILLIISLCLYLISLLVSCVLLLVRTSHLHFTLDKALGYPNRAKGHSALVAVLSAGFLLPLLLLLLIQAKLVSAAKRTYHHKGRFHQGYNPFDLGCARNWYWTMCVPLGPKYMSDNILLQRIVGHDWVHLHAVSSPKCEKEHCVPVATLTGPQPLSVYTPGKEPPGRGKAEDLQEVCVSPVHLQEALRRDSTSDSSLRT